VKDFHELKVWRKAHLLTLSVCQAKSMTSQIRRASVSIGANLAKGCGGNGDVEFARFCSIAMGSASELEYHLLLAAGVTELKRMLARPLHKLTADL